MATLTAKSDVYIVRVIEFNGRSKSSVDVMLTFIHILTVALMLTFVPTLTAKSDDSHKLGYAK